MDPALNKNESEFGILVFSVSLQVLSDIYCLLDKVVKIFWNFRCQTILFEDSENLIACDSFNLGDSIVVSEYHTNL